MQQGGGTDLDYDSLPVPETSPARHVLLVKSIEQSFCILNIFIYHILKSFLNGYSS